MKEQKTYTGTQNILQQGGAFLLYTTASAIMEEGSGVSTAIGFGLIIAAIILSVDGNIKRLRAFGFTGDVVNFLFPNLTDGTYPNKDKNEKE